MPTQKLAQAVRLHQTGKLTEAKQMYRDILAIDPKNMDSLHLLGLIAYQSGDFENSVELILEALSITETVPTYHYNLGCVLRDAGKLEEAATHFRRALELNPDYAEACNNLSLIYLGQNKIPEVIKCLKRVTVMRPDNAVAHNDLGSHLQNLGRLDEAIASYERARVLLPGNAEIHFNLGLALMMKGDANAALASYRKAAAIAPANLMYWSHIAGALQETRFTSIDGSMLQDLEALLEKPNVRPCLVSRPILNALRLRPDFLRLLTLARDESPELTESIAATAERLCGIPLFIRLMSLGPITGLEVENMLTRLRRALVLSSADGEAASKGLPFFTALAIQCFFNEYVYPETAEESQAANRLEKNMSKLVEEGKEIPPVWLAALGAYRPLHRFTWAEALRERAWPEETKPLIEKQIEEPLEELSSRAAFRCLTPMKDAVSLSVREQYEQNPYPRWIRAELHPTPMSVKEVLKTIFPTQDFSDYRDPPAPEILIAGCGTGQHAVAVASRFKDARILAIDLSLSSLSYAARKSRELGFTKIDYAQADILELGELNRLFDIIESGGVLHHLGDPMAGWRVLTKLLRPGGFMKIGLYSEIARGPVVKAREIIKEKGYTAAPEDIRRFRGEVLGIMAQTKMTPIIDYIDFYSLSECRDLLFHVQEHRFTLPQIEVALKELGLQFLGFELLNLNIYGRFRKENPDPAALSSLTLWHEFELKNPTTFTGMYQFWCRKP